MGERTSYAPGTFSWAELVTSDADAAKAFYTSVFGWEYRDNPIPDGSVYSTALRDGKDVAALFASEQPPHWNCYVTVESADAAAARASELGATIAAEAFDVMDVGRMAVIVDPVGAALCLWEPKSHIGATLVNTLGRDDLERPDHARPGGVGELLRRPVRLDDRGDPGRRRLPRDQERRARQRRDDAARPAHGLDAAELDAVLRPRGRRAAAGRGRGLGGQVCNGPMRDVAGHDRGARPIRRARRSRSWTGEYDD